MVMIENLQFRFSMTLGITSDIPAKEAGPNSSKGSLGSHRPLSQGK